MLIDFNKEATRNEDMFKAIAHVERHVVYHLNCGHVVVAKETIDAMSGMLSYPCKIIQNPQITPQGGIHVSTVLIPLAMYSNENKFSSKIFENSSFLWYTASKDLIEMYEKVISGFKAKQSGIVVPQFGIN